jgi:uncharacterized protein YndB with AHSA1/START domain
MRADVLIEEAFPHRIERVWAALTSSDALAAWLMPNDFRPVTGHRFTLRTAPAPGFDGVVRCAVLELEPPTRMVWSWAGGPIDTTVTFTLTDLGTRGTRFRMHQVGFHGLRGQLARIVLQGGGPRLTARLGAHLLDLDGRPAGEEEDPECVDGWRALLPWHWHSRRTT